MNFVIDKDWEHINPVFDALGDGERRRFSVLELSLEACFFIVNVDAGEVRKTLFFSSTQEFLSFASENINSNIVVSLLSMRYDNDGRYSVSDIASIEKGVDEAGQTAYVYYCVDGKSYVDSALAEFESELSGLKTVYKHSKA